MVILFSNRKSKLEKEILEILTAWGADFITDKSVTVTGGYFTVAVCYKKTDLALKKGIALILDDTDRFKALNLPQGIYGICEDKNSSAIEIFSKNNIPVVTCGSNHKNTLTLSSINERDFVITLQREITDLNGKPVYPADFILSFKKSYSPQAVLLSTAVLCLSGAEI